MALFFVWFSILHLIEMKMTYVCNATLSNEIEFKKEKKKGLRNWYCRKMDPICCLFSSNLLPEVEEMCRESSPFKKAKPL